MLLALFAVIAVTFDLWVYRPVNGLIRRSRKRLGGTTSATTRSTATRSASSATSSARSSPCSRPRRTRSGSRRASRTTWMRVQSLNRQLMDVGVLGREMNAALPYRETVERVLSRSRDVPARRLRRAAAARRGGARLLARGRPGRPHADALGRVLRVHARLPGAPGDRVGPDHARRGSRLHALPAHHDPPAGHPGQGGERRRHGAARRRRPAASTSGCSTTTS